MEINDGMLMGDGVQWEVFEGVGLENRNPDKCHCCEILLGSE